MKYPKLCAFAGALLILASWELTCRGLAIPDFILPMPTQIFSVAIFKAGLLLPHAGATALEVLLGILISLSVAVPLSMIMFAFLISVISVPVLCGMGIGSKTGADDNECVCSSFLIQ